QATSHSPPRGRLVALMTLAGLVGAARPSAEGGPTGAPTATPQPVPVRVPELPMTGALSAAVAAQGEGVAALAASIRSGKKLAHSATPRSPGEELRGPDGELLRLQEAVLALELEVLTGRSR